MINIGMEMIKTYNPEFITVTESATDHLVTQIENQNGVGVALGVKPVSYTHLTLPTNREV